MNRRIGFLAVFLGLMQCGFAQETAGLDSIYNTNSPMFPTAERIAYYEQLYRYRITRFVDLGERQNAGFSSRKSNIGGLILSLLNENKIKPFSGAYGDPADFEAPMPDTAALVLSANFVKSQTRGNWKASENYQVGERVIVPTVDDHGGTDEKVYAALQDNSGKDPQTNGSYWQDQGSMSVKVDKASVVGIELIEDMIFDKRKSRLTYDILAIGVDLVDQSSGQVIPRFYIKYADLCAQIERLYKSPRASERASVMWQNRYNPSENKKFTDAFKLRLFHGIIRKVENPNDQSIMETIYDKSGGKGSYAEGVFAMWEKEMQLMEQEHNLWEF